jgi:excisionase family DNA binding protein
MTRHDATNDATRDTTERDNVSFEEAARRLGVSLRTVQRRVRDGHLNSIESEGGRLVCLTPDATEGATRDKPCRDSDATPRQIDATKRATAQAGSTPDVAASLAQSREEVLFLRGLVEQHQRSESELRAALRKALDAMPKALPDGEKLNEVGREKLQQVATDLGQVRTENESSENAPGRAQTIKPAQPARSTPNAAQRQPQREMRPLWKVILGIR